MRMAALSLAHAPLHRVDHAVAVPRPFHVLMTVNLLAHSLLTSHSIESYTSILSSVTILCS